MASPQKENGFTPIAHEIIEHLARVRMSGAEWQYAMCVFRKTYGFHKKEDWVTNTQISQMSGLCKERVSEAKRRLLARNIVTENRNKISFQKDWEKWVELRKSVSNSYGIPYQELRKSVHTIDTITIDTKKGDSNESQGLSNKKKDMGGFNRVGDDYDEGVVDLDGDGSLTPTEKPKKIKRNYKEVYGVFFRILGKTPANWLVNATQQKCADNLFTERGLEQIEKALVFYVENKDQEFCPDVSTPYDLDSKWSKLHKFSSK